MINILEPREHKIDPEAIKPLFMNGLEYILKAYIRLCDSFPFHYKKEDDINDALYCVLSDILQSEEGSSILTAIPQSYDPRQRLLYGRASMVDLAIRWSADSIDEKYQFWFEFKRLSCKDKSKAYINHGIERYEKNFYSKDMPYAAMIGYIEKGNVEDIVEDINKKMTTSCLNNITTKGGFFWNSNHSRPGNVPIDLYHVFLDFRDCQKNPFMLCPGQNLRFSRIGENTL